MNMMMRDDDVRAMAQPAYMVFFLMMVPEYHEDALIQQQPRLPQWRAGRGAHFQDYDITLTRAADDADCQL